MMRGPVAYDDGYISRKMSQLQTQAPPMAAQGPSAGGYGRPPPQGYMQNGFEATQRGRARSLGGPKSMVDPSSAAVQMRGRSSSAVRMVNGIGMAGSGALPAGSLSADALQHIRDINMQLRQAQLMPPEKDAFVTPYLWHEKDIGAKKGWYRADFGTGRKTEYHFLPNPSDRMNFLQQRSASPAPNITTMDSPLICDPQVRQPMKQKADLFADSVQAETLAMNIENSSRSSHRHSMLDDVITRAKQGPAGYDTRRSYYWQYPHHRGLTSRRTTSLPRRLSMIETCPVHGAPVNTCSTRAVDDAELEGPTQLSSPLDQRSPYKFLEATPTLPELKSRMYLRGMGVKVPEDAAIRRGPSPPPLPRRPYSWQENVVILPELNAQMLLGTNALRSIGIKSPVVGGYPPMGAPPMGGPPMRRMPPPPPPPMYYDYDYGYGQGGGYDYYGGGYAYPQQAPMAPQMPRMSRYDAYMEEDPELASLGMGAGPMGPRQSLRPRTPPQVPTPIKGRGELPPTSMAEFDQREAMLQDHVDKMRIRLKSLAYSLDPTGPVPEIVIPDRTGANKITSVQSGEDSKKKYSMALDYKEMPNLSTRRAIRTYPEDEYMKDNLRIKCLSHYKTTRTAADYWRPKLSNVSITDGTTTDAALPESYSSKYTSKYQSKWEEPDTIYGSSSDKKPFSKVETGSSFFSTYGYTSRKKDTIAEKVRDYYYGIDDKEPMAEICPAPEPAQPAIERKKSKKKSTVKEELLPMEPVHIPAAEEPISMSESAAAEEPFDPEADEKEKKKLEKKKRKSEREAAAKAAMEAELAALAAAEAELARLEQESVSLATPAGAHEEYAANASFEIPTVEVQRADVDADSAAFTS